MENLLFCVLHVCVSVYVSVHMWVCCTSYMWLSICVGGCAHLNVHMWRPEVDFIYFTLCSLLTFLRQSLSLNLELFISARLPGQEALSLFLYSQRWTYSHVPSYLDFSCLGRESGSHAYVNISPTESYTIPMAYSLTNGG